MMSDSDDTDVLLLIPPDLFLVPSSSESDVSSDRVKTDSTKPGVISELMEHMQSLESRISLIESKDNSLDATLLNNSLESQINPAVKYRQTLPRCKFSLSESCSLQNTPVKPRQSLSTPSTPNSHSLPNCINYCQNEMKLGNHNPASMGTNVTNEYEKSKHDSLTSKSSVVVPFTACNVGFPHVTPSEGELCSFPFDCRNTIHIKPSFNELRSMPSTSTLLSATEQLQLNSKACIQKMELSEVDELLQEMEATDLELSKRISKVSERRNLMEQNGILSNDSSDSFKDKCYSNAYKNSINRRLEFEPQDFSQHGDILFNIGKKKSDIIADVSLPYNDSFRTNETDKTISEFKVWNTSMESQASKTEKVEEATAQISLDSINKSAVQANSIEKRESVIQHIPSSTHNVNNTNSVNVDDTQTHRTLNIPLHSELRLYNTVSSSADHNILHLLDTSKNLQQNGNVQYVKRAHNVPLTKNIAHASTNTDILPRKSQRFLSLSDFWENNSSKSQEEIHRIKLEEEKFRREHCENLIQELQKRLLEQQEKVAVALRVDNEKNELIAQFQVAWSKLKQRVHVLENEYSALQTNLKNVTEKHQSEISEFQSQIKRCEGELSKALDLAAGYKEKNDIATKERVELLKIHADELENYKSFVQEAESKYEKLKVDHNKLSEKNQHTEETLRSLQQELGKERLKGGEVRNEMDDIHRALDRCEAELIVLRQEKENLLLKLKEENNRNSILENKNTSLLSALDEAKKAEKLAKDETKLLAEQREKIRSELQAIYQKQVDEVVKVKLQEFQAQLDAAESEFHQQLKHKQQVIAECAARKLKDVMDRDRLEINLLEEKHKEEKRMYELQLATALEKSSYLESLLNSQRATKSQLAEQLHSVMQKQWQQALHIISGGNTENLTTLQKIPAEKLFELKVPKKSESMPNCYARIPQEPIKLSSHTSSMKNFHDQNGCMSSMFVDQTPLSSRKETHDEFRNYMRMITDVQEPKDEFSKIGRRISSPPLVCREVPRKHYLKKEESVKDDDSIAWQAASEVSEFTLFSLDHSKH